ncbi:MAG TPA: DUF502 domain-containing protein [Alphaproteobacteria bacterium]|nr:DUF502 domain-containing protein [Alphaproteobacteria bacterium]
MGEGTSRKSSKREKNNPGGKAGENPGPGSLGARLRTYFLAGILVTAPITITLYAAWIFVAFVDGKVTPLIPESYNPSTYLPFDIPGLGLVVMAVVLILIGWLTAGFLGRLFLRISERILRRMPVISGMYSAIKQIFETVLKKQSNAFREAVLVEYPRRGVWAIAFITGRTKGEVQSLIEEEVINVFLPTTPNPTSGFLLFVPRKDIIPLNMTVEEAIKMVISGGIVTPSDRRPEAEQKITRASAATYEDIDILREKDRTPVLVTKKK